MRGGRCADDVEFTRGTLQRCKTAGGGLCPCGCRTLDPLMKTVPECASAVTVPEWPQNSWLGLLLLPRVSESTFAIPACAR